MVIADSGPNLSLYHTFVVRKSGTGGWGWVVGTDRLPASENVLDGGTRPRLLPGTHGGWEDCPRQAEHAFRPRSATGADIWPVGDEVVSQRFTQLLNTFWIINIAPQAATGNFTFNEDPAPIPLSYLIQNTTGSVASNDPVLGANWGWMVMLVVSSSVMFVAGVLAAALRLLRRGADILDRTSLLLRDSSHANVGPASSARWKLDLTLRQDSRMSRSTLVTGERRRRPGVWCLAPLGKAKPLARRRKGRLYA